MKTHILAFLCLVFAVSTAGKAQETQAPPPTQSELTEGLLDLLKDSAESKTPAPKPSTSEPTPASDPQGEDLGQAPEHPLKPVQESMAEIADRLRSGVDVAGAQQQQRDVVLRLDELIARLDQQSKSKANSAPNSSANSAKLSSQSTASQNRSEASSSPSASKVTQSSSGSKLDRANPGTDKSGSSSAERNRNNAPGTEPDDQQPNPSGSQDSGESQPGTSPLGNRKAIIDLSDPTALQRSAWGNLPDRMRQQMQSRMVERFLPSYREEIEAYYRALAK